MCARFLALTIDSVGDMLGPVGKFWRMRRTISQAEAQDMRQRILYLDEQVRALRFRDECYFAYMVYDQEYHRKAELTAAEFGWILDKHVTFLEFRQRWVKDRNLQNEASLWT